jgi:hypothetical protein
MFMIYHHQWLIIKETIAIAGVIGLADGGKRISTRPNINPVATGANKSKTVNETGEYESPFGFLCVLFINAHIPIKRPETNPKFPGAKD